jgi:hypothetical protein
MHYRLSYVSRGALSLKTPAPLYICISIKQYNHLTFDGTPLSNTTDVTVEILDLEHLNLAHDSMLHPVRFRWTMSFFS